MKNNQEISMNKLSDVKNPIRFFESLIENCSIGKFKDAKIKEEFRGLERTILKIDDDGFTAFLGCDEENPNGATYTFSFAKYFMDLCNSEFIKSKDLIQSILLSKTSTSQQSVFLSTIIKSLKFLHKSLLDKSGDDSENSIIEEKISMLQSYCMEKHGDLIISTNKMHFPFSLNLSFTSSSEKERNEMFIDKYLEALQMKYPIFDKNDFKKAKDFFAGAKIEEEEDICEIQLGANNRLFTYSILKLKELYTNFTKESITRYCHFIKKTIKDENTGSKYLTADDMKVKNPPAQKEEIDKLYHEVKNRVYAEINK